jgi:DNA primase
VRKVPEGVIAEIRDRTDLVELIGGYVTLKRSGRNFLGLCPFHREKTPSFNVSPERGIYHCFGCGVTGDAFKFLQEHDHVSFPEALRTLAARAGVELSRFEDDGSTREEHDLLYQAHAIAARLYRKLLREPEGRAAREEIARRGLSAAIVDEYRLGASADAWDRLIQEARREGIRPELVERAGLAIRRESGTGWYDRFRGRLMFPIEAAGGKTVGFGGRVLGEGEPKYLNSPETPLFRKRKTLYGVPQAMDAFRERREAILVEGYTDVLALANAGVRGAVAALGTAFTPEHAAWLARSCDKVTVLFDGDEAGRRATVASAGPLLGSGLAVRIARLPEGEDPDSFVRNQGIAALHKALESATGVVEALLGEEAYSGPEGLERSVTRVLEAIAPIEDPLRREVYLEELKTATGLETPLLRRRLAALQQDLEKMRDRVASREQATSRPSAAAKVAPAPDRAHEPLDRPAPSTPPVVEVTFLAIVLHDGAIGADLLARHGPEAFEHPLTRRIAERASAIVASGRPLEAGALLDASADDEPARKLLGELAVSNQYTVEIARQAEDCEIRLERRGLEREMERITTEMRKAKARGDGESVRECQRRQHDVARGLAKLAAPRAW